MLHDRFALLQHRARSLWGLLTRLTAKLLAFTLLTLWQHQGYDVD